MTLGVTSKKFKSRKRIGSLSKRESKDFEDKRRQRLPALALGVRTRWMWLETKLMYNGHGQQWSWLRDKVTCIAVL